MSSSEQLLLAIPKLDPRPLSEEAVDDIVWDFFRGVLAADGADDTEFLVALAEYGRRYEVIVEVELPVREPRTIKLLEDRPLELGGMGATAQRFALGDARSSHLEARITDPNVVIRGFDVFDVHGAPTRLGWIEAARHSSETLSIYSSEPGRPYYVDVKLRLRPDRQVSLSSILLVVLNLAALLAVVLAPRDAAFVERIALLVVPTTIAAAFTVVREQTTLASRLLSPARAALGITTLALWLLALIEVTTFHEWPR